MDGREAEAMTAYSVARPDRDRGPIGQGMDALNEAIDRAVSLVRSLEEKIDPILAPPSPTAVDVALVAVTGDSTVAGFLRTQVRQIEELCDRVNAIRNRVEL